MDEDPIEQSFDEAARTDPRPVEVNLRNALNELHFALHKTQDAIKAVRIVNAIAELDKFLDGDFGSK